MAKKAKKARPPRRPTDRELAILQVLWKRGPSTVREVLEVLDDERGYTTVLKFMQILHEKELLTREKRGNTHVYSAAFAESEIERNLVRDLLDRVFDSSPRRLVLHALSEKRATPEELAEIRKLIDELEEGQR